MQRLFFFPSVEVIPECGSTLDSSLEPKKWVDQAQMRLADYVVSSSLFSWVTLKQSSTTRKLSALLGRESPQCLL